MAKRGQHDHDANDPNVSKGHNNPEKSVTVTAGTPKKRETYAAQARQGKDPARQAQAQRNDWQPDTREHPSSTGSTRARDSDITGGRSGSDSNASRRTRR